MKRMKPQPPEGTAKVQQIGATDSFDCLGFGKDAPHYVMLAVVHRTIGSTVRPVCKDGTWYWSNAVAAMHERVERWENELRQMSGGDRWGESRRFAGRSAGIRIERRAWLISHIATAKTKLEANGKDETQDGQDN